MTFKVVQWTTGPVARSAVRGVLAHPELDLVGAYAWSPEKAGKDVGELCNLPPLGIVAVSDVEGVIALKPDIVLYMPLVWNVNHMVQLLEAGINVIATSNFVTGSAYGAEEQARLQAAALRGSASIYGTGSNPGLASTVVLAATGGSREVEYVGIHEAADCTPYQSAQTWRDLGFGSTPDTPGLSTAAQARQAVFREAVEAMAKALGMTLDDVRFDLEFGIATEDLDLGYMQIKKGTICGQKSVWRGLAGGSTRLEFSLLWRLGNAMEPDWPVHDGHVVEIKGTPNIKMSLSYFHSADPDDFNAITANPAVNAIPAVVAARPGIITVDELTLITSKSTRVVR